MAYRGLDHALDLGEIREHLKRTACAVYARPLTVRDIERLDTILRAAQAHRRGGRPRRSAPARISAQEQRWASRPLPPEALEPVWTPAQLAAKIAEIEAQYAAP